MRFQAFLYRRQGSRRTTEQTLGFVFQVWSNLRGGGSPYVTAREQGFSVATPAIAVHRGGVLCPHRGLVESHITAIRRSYVESPLKI